ncbi:PREDICTED: probable inactive histone-lysine N-methyltransferase SUVR2 isoform X4 [Theobroma cacao]|uniref:Probable inactive histone-lysine N-methyltransferase SUVR2 isoform X4 n=1 Tax=Theobroma cacao TaxID=3641 RepID=A0AB32WPM2_THECC|nr:PREDICTED: probable inactive histone-lysine N-methyltransferase SUVR2 isoform X4 [Theobroma cacao]
MAPNPRVVQAFRSMKEIGITEEKVKPVLKKLLKVYDKNWELIAAENYRVLADAIFEEEDNKVSEPKKGQKCDEEEDTMEEGAVPDELVRPLKRIRLKNQEGLASSSHNNGSTDVAGPFLKKPKVEEDELPPASLRQQSLQCNVGNMTECLPASPGCVSLQPTAPGPVSPHQGGRNKGKQPVAPMPLAVLEGYDQNLHSTQMHVSYKGKEPMSPHVTSNEKGPERVSLALCIKDPAPCPGIITKKRVPDTHALIIPKEEPFTDDMPQDEVPIAIIHPDSLSRKDSPIGHVSTGKSNWQEHPESLFADENVGAGASASMSERHISCELATVPDEIPSSLEIASSPLGEEGNVMPALDLLKKSPARDALDAESNKENGCLPAKMLNGALDVQCSSNGCVDNVEGKELVVVQQHQLTSNELRWLHDASDITKGEEKVEISWVNEINKDFPPPFHYISENLVFQNAYVKFSLSRIGDESCCPTCFGDCLLSEQPCACACQAGGKFVYTSAGVVREDFLEECISVTRDPQRQCFLNCTECPLERSKKDDFPEPCKGHLKRKVIKECWSKCGCNKQCGNRVVQRGVNYKLQVFLTPDGKGWGLRTLEKLPKGAFICEFVGEILTISELYARNTEKHTCPILLDAYWGLKGVSKDEEALCLDATGYGNVARFINHRCLDANLIEIPVEVETPDLHYYHLAFFTTREIDALEELTWDYGIDFDDLDHPVKAFRCRCGSKFCRNMKRSTRYKSAIITR